jgi:hypothetical protein
MAKNVKKVEANPESKSQRNKRKKVKWSYENNLTKLIAIVERCRAVGFKGVDTAKKLVMLDTDTPAGIKIWGKLDYLCNHLGYKIDTYSKTALKKGQVI